MIKKEVEINMGGVLKKNNASAKKTATYEEKAPFSNTIKVILTLSFLALALIYFSAVFAPSFDSKEMPDNAVFVLNLVLIICCLAIWGFFSMKFRITDSSVEAVMPPFRFQIRFFEIESVTTIDKIPWHVGWGLGTRAGFCEHAQKSCRD